MAAELFSNSLSDEIRRCARAENVIRFFIENDDIVSATHLARLTMDRLSDVIERARALSDYNKSRLGIILCRELAAFEGDCVALREAEKNVHPDTPGSALTEITDRLETYVKCLAKEAASFGRTSEPLRTTTRRFLRKIIRLMLAQWVPLMGSVAALLLIWAGFHRYRTTHSLKAEYFIGANFEKLLGTGRATSIDFNWGRRNIFGGVKSEKMSIRWTGLVRAPVTGDYAFSTYSSDGVRVWLDEKIIIDDWGEHSLTRDDGTSRLRAGFHRLQVDYFTTNGAAEIHLLWRPPESPLRFVIPERFFISDDDHLPADGA